MARCVPDSPRWADGSHAERAVWEALREQLPEEATLFHSVNLQVGPREQEIDVLVVWPGVGIAAIEVKGGHVSCEQGQWFQSSGGVRRPIGSPVEQVQGARHVLERYLDSRGAGRLGRFAHVVAFPYTPVASTWSSGECPRTMLIDRDDLPSAAERVRSAVLEHGAGNSALTGAGADRVVAALVNDLADSGDHLALSAEHESRVEQMTRDQAKTLDALKYFPRAKIVGGAGSGKTWLALEQARRLARSGQRVALLCYSRGLGRYFERVTSTWPARERPAFVGLFHRLPVVWGAEEGSDNDSDYWETRLPLRLGELARERLAVELFDTIVVDEAQDFGELWWPSLMSCLRSPDEGGLYVFLDEHQRVFDRHGRDPIDLPPIALDENIRNTKQIAQLFGSLTEETVKPRGLPGPPVRLIDVPPEDAVTVADESVEALLDEGWDPGRIALLTTNRRHPEQRNSVEIGGWAAYWDDFFTATDVFYGHVLGFKGLERSAIVLAVNGFSDPERARRMLYVGLSRARSLLVVVGPRRLIEEVGGDGVRSRLKKAEAWDPGR